MRVSIDVGSNGKPARRRRSRRTVVVLLASSLLFTCVIGLIIRAYFLHDADQCVADAEAEADRLDPGWRWDDLVARRATIPDDKNGALIVLAAGKELPKDWPPNSKQENKEGELLSEMVERMEPAVQLQPEMLAAIRAAVTEAAQAQARLDPLLDCTTGRFPLNLHRDILSTPCLHVPTCRRLGTLQFLTATLAAEDADAPKALRHCRMLLNVGRSLGDEPFSFSMLVRAACQRWTALSVERLLGQTVVKEEALAKLQRDFLTELEVDLLLVALRGERATIPRVYHAIATGEFDASPVPSEFDFDPLQRWSYIGCLARYGEAHVLTMYNQAVEIAKRPVGERRALWKAWGESLQAFANEEKKKPSSKLLALLMLPGLHRVADHLYDVRVHLTCATAALAAERFRQTTGKWPNAWDQLVPTYLAEVPRDLFDDTPLHIRILNDGVLIYSFGPDGQDDSGYLLRGKNRTKQAGNIGFRLWNPDKRRQPPPKPEEKNP
jgi:hypothetical protein